MVSPMKTTLRVQPFFDERTSTLSYVVFEPSTKDAFVIDPVLDFEPASGRVWTESVEKLAAFLDAEHLVPRFILETHAHADHLSGSQWLKQRYGAPIAVSARIREVQEVFQGVFAWPELRTDGSQFDRLLEDDDTLFAGPLRLRALATPGHTPACMSFQVEDAVFTGDALFLDDVGVGRCDFPKGDAGALYESVTRALFTLPDETRLFVGHDYPPPGRSWQAMTTVGAAKKANVQLRADMAKAEFVEKRTARDRTLTAPRLLYPSIQVNVVAGRLPDPQAGGRRFLKLPLTGA